MFQTSFTSHVLYPFEGISIRNVFFSPLQAGLDAMLSVPRQANDTMYLCMIEGFNVSSFIQALFSVSLNLSRLPAILQSDV